MTDSAQLTDLEAVARLLGYVDCQERFGRYGLYKSPNIVEVTMGGWELSGACLEKLEELGYNFDLQGTDCDQGYVYAVSVYAMDSFGPVPRRPWHAEELRAPEAVIRCAAAVYRQMKGGGE